MRPILVTVLATFGAAAVISACDRSPPEPQTDIAMSPQPVAGASSPGAVPLGAGPKRDPSVPSAASAIDVPPPAPPHAGTDSNANPPLGDMTRQKESEQMPRALDGNNHSSPNTGSAPAR